MSRSNNIGGMNNLDDIVASGKLVAFILGQDEFSPSTANPQEDYNRWNRLVEWYRSHRCSQYMQQRVEQTVLSLFESSDPVAKSTSLTLSRLLELHRIETKITKLVRQGRFKDLTPRVQNTLLLTVAKLQMDSLADFLVDNMVKRGKLRELLMWSDTPGYVTSFGRGDLWRMRAIAHYFERTADAETRKVIENQIGILVQEVPKIREILREFLQRSALEYKEFSKIIM